MVSSVHHYHCMQVPVSDKNQCIQLAMQSESTFVLKTKALYKLVNNNSLSSVFSDLKLQKAEKNFFVYKQNRGHDWSRDRVVV